MSEALQQALLERAKRERQRRAGSNTHPSRAKIEAARRGELEIPQGRLEQQREIDQNTADQVLLESQPAGTGLAAKAVQGIPFAGEFVDEAFDAINPGQGERLRQVQGAMDRQRPGASLAAGVAGGIVGSLPLAAGAAGAKAANFVAQGANRLSQAGRAAAVAAPVATLEGGVSGFGRGETEEERLTNAGKGALIGGGLGAVLGGAAPSIGAGISNLIKRAKKLDVRTIAEEFGISPAAARSVREALKNDDLSAAASRLGQLGDDALLADAGPSTQALLDASSKTGGEALTAARVAATQRSEAIGQRLPKRLDSILGKPTGVKQAAREIAQSTSPKRQAAFDAAFSKPIDYAEDTGRAIEDVLSRVPPRTLNSAIEEANEELVAAGLSNQQILAEIAEDGSVAFREMPNVQQLHQVKMALDTIARGNVDQFGRPTAQGIRAQKLARQLRDAVKKAVPEYTTALKLGGDKIQQDQGLDLGRRLLFKKTTVEDVRDFMSDGVSADARDSIRQGLRSSIEDTLSNVRRTIGDPDVDAREAMQLVKEISSRANKTKITMVLGKSRASALLNELDRAATALQLRGAIARNSDTAIRQAVQGQVKDEATPGLLRRTLGKGGNPLDAAQQLTETIAGIDPRSMSNAEQEIFAEIAQALTNIKGKDAQRALRIVQSAMEGQGLKDAQARFISRVVTGGSLAGSHQVGQQTLAR